MDEIAELAIEGFRKKPWLADTWRSLGTPLAGYDSYKVEVQTALLSLKADKSRFSPDEWERIAETVERGLEGITERPTGPLMAT